MLNTGCWHQKCGEKWNVHKGYIVLKIYRKTALCCPHQPLSTFTSEILSPCMRREVSVDSLARLGKWDDCVMIISYMLWETQLEPTVLIITEIFDSLFIPYQGKRYASATEIFTIIILYQTIYLDFKGNSTGLTIT